eukprot:Trichotokara_eunicae@DN4331_c0_g1_i3.p1
MVRPHSWPSKQHRRFDSLSTSRFILNVLKTEPARNARLAQAHLRYIGALERMIAEKIVLVEEKFKMKDRSWRTIKANERICPLGWWYDQVSQSEFEAETVTKIVGQ